MELTARRKQTTTPKVQIIPQIVARIGQNVKTTAAAAAAVQQPDTNYDHISAVAFVGRLHFPGKGSHPSVRVLVRGTDRTEHNLCERMTCSRGPPRNHGCSGIVLTRTEPTQDVAAAAAATAMRAITH